MENKTVKEKSVEISKHPKHRDIIKRWDWLLVAAIAPAMLLLDASQAWMLLAVPLVLVVQWLTWGEVLPVTPLNPAILLIAVMVIVSIAMTPDLAGSLVSIAGVLYGMVVYFCVARHTRSKEGWRGGLILLVLTGIGLSTLGLVGIEDYRQKIVGLSTLTPLLTDRLGELTSGKAGINPNILAGTLLWVIPVILMAGLALVREPRWFGGSKRTEGVDRGEPSSSDDPHGANDNEGSNSKISSDSTPVKSKISWMKVLGWGVLILVAVLSSMYVLILTQSRAGYIAFLLGIMVVVILLLRRRVRWITISLLAFIAVISVILMQTAGWGTILGTVYDRLQAISTPSSLDTWNMRLEIWSRAIWVIKDAPLTGLGMNSFAKVVSIIYPTFQVSTAGGLHAHNELLQAAIDLGLPGLIGFIALYAGGLGMLIPSIRSTGANRYLSLGLLGGLLAHFTYGLTSVTILASKPGFIFWWLLGMIFGNYSQNRSSVGGK